MNKRKRTKPASRSAGSELIPAQCPECGSDCIGQCDLVPGHAILHGVTKTGDVAWSGATEMDWDNQRPDSNPREWQCMACSHRAEPAAFFPPGTKVKQG